MLSYFSAKKRAIASPASSSVKTAHSNTTAQDLKPEARCESPSTAAAISLTSATQTTLLASAACEQQRPNPDLTSPAFTAADSSCTSPDADGEDTSYNAGHSLLEQPATTTLASSSRPRYDTVANAYMDGPTCLLAAAANALHASRLPEQLPCRGAEIAAIDAFLKGSLMGCRAGSIYIAGSPGVGKTAVVVRSMRCSFPFECAH